MLNSKTFGRSHAAIKLVEIINEQKLPISKIGNFYSKFTYFLIQLNGIDDSGLRIGIGNRYYHERSQMALKYPVVGTYLNNIMSTYYKKWLRENNASKTSKQRDNKKSLYVAANTITNDFISFSNVKQDLNELISVVGDHYKNNENIKIYKLIEVKK